MFALLTLEMFQFRYQYRKWCWYWSKCRYVYCATQETPGNYCFSATKKKLISCDSYRASNISAIWRYFSPTSETGMCSVCKAAIWRGGTSVASFEPSLLKLYETVREQLEAERCAGKQFWPNWHLDLRCVLIRHAGWTQYGCIVCPPKCHSTSKQVPWEVLRRIIYS